MSRELDQQFKAVCHKLKDERRGYTIPNWVTCLETEIEILKEQCVSNPEKAVSYAGAVNSLRRILHATKPVDPNEG